MSDSNLIDFRYSRIFGQAAYVEPREMADARSAILDARLKRSREQHQGAVNQLAELRALRRFGAPITEDQIASAEGVERGCYAVFVGDLLDWVRAGVKEGA